MHRLAITAGEPAGIGPDLALALADQDWPVELVVVADPELLAERARLLNLNVQLKTVALDAPFAASTRGLLHVLPVALTGHCQAGQLNADNSRYVLNTLDTAINGCQQGYFDALVTGPVHKGIINESGIAFSGHTEYLADKTDTDRVVMMLATEGLRVALATTHLPLKDVPAAITQPLLEEVIGILHTDLVEKFGIARPRILVAGLNPHAGENGHMGREEIDTIEPVLNRLRERGLDLSAPLPADTLFTPKLLDNTDAVLAMYHDQGLPVLKYKGFGQAVNITLGLPIIRTSVDHGTALDLAGMGKANSGSLLTAIDYAVRMAHSRQRPVSENQRRSL